TENEDQSEAKTTKEARGSRSAQPQVMHGSSSARVRAGVGGAWEHHNAGTTARSAAQAARAHA
ncbi:hypothetical protein U1Q18_032602, partial [Sarracenia purpurea var. burkii]